MVEKSSCVLTHACVSLNYAVSEKYKQARRRIMALKGNPRDFSTTQLLNLINLARKTGTLTIEGNGATARMSFREGKLIYALEGQERQNHLAGILEN